MGPSTIIDSDQASFFQRHNEYHEINHPVAQHLKNRDWRPTMFVGVARKRDGPFLFQSTNLVPIFPKHVHCVTYQYLAGLLERTYFTELFSLEPTRVRKGRADVVRC